MKNPKLKSIQNTKTNDQMLKQLLEEITPMEAALLRERIVKIMEITENSINNEPEKWKNNFIHPNAYKELNKKIQACLGFENDK